jgi:ADP-dependent phosphofructokinase/glucokinase
LIEKEFQFIKNGAVRKNLITSTLANFTLIGLEKIVQNVLQTSPFKQRFSKYFHVDFVRYGNNFIILSNNKRFLENRILLNVNSFLVSRGLSFFTQKPTLFRLKDQVELKFLGYVFYFYKK